MKKITKSTETEFLRLTIITHTSDKCIFTIIKIVSVPIKVMKQKAGLAMIYRCNIVTLVCDLCSVKMLHIDITLVM